MIYNSVSGGIEIVNYLIKFGAPRETVAQYAIKSFQVDILIDQLRNGIVLTGKEENLIDFLKIANFRKPGILIELAKEFDCISPDICLKAILIDSYYDITNNRYVDMIMVDIESDEKQESDTIPDDIDFFIEMGADIQLVEDYILDV